MTQVYVQGQEPASSLKLTLSALPRDNFDWVSLIVGQDVILRRVANPPGLRRLAIGAQVSNLPHTHYRTNPDCGILGLIG
jgi:hypothetical protein